MGGETIGTSTTSLHLGAHGWLGSTLSKQLLTGSMLVTYLLLTQPGHKTECFEWGSNLAGSPAS